MHGGGGRVGVGGRHGVAAAVATSSASPSRVGRLRGLVSLVAVRLHDLDHLNHANLANLKDLHAKVFSHLSASEQGQLSSACLIRAFCGLIFVSDFFSCRHPSSCLDPSPSLGWLTLRGLSLRDPPEAAAAAFYIYSISSWLFNG